MDNHAAFEEGRITTDEWIAGTSVSFALDPVAYVNAWDSITLFTESFYFFAWRLMEALNVRDRANRLRFPELREVEAAGVRTVRPQTRTWALVPSRAKHDVLTAVRRLRQDGVDLPGTPVFGLVDADRDNDPGEDYIIPWPVAMIENLLLDSEAIYDALRQFGALTTASSPTVVADVLAGAACDRVENEVRLRVQRALPTGRSPCTRTGWTTSTRWSASRSRVGLADVRADAIVQAGAQLERFHGKRILHAVYKALNVNAVLTTAGFALAIAERAAGNERVQQLTEPAIARVTLYIPAGLPEALRAAGDPATEQLAASCQRHRTAWAAGQLDPAGREQLRDQVFTLARTCDADPLCAHPIGQ